MSFKLSIDNFPEYEVRRGFHLVFENGWTASVQWGLGSYSENKFSKIDEIKESSSTAEVWAWRKIDENCIQNYPEDGPEGHLDANEVASFLNEVANFD